MHNLPYGATAGEEFVPYTYSNYQKTCKDIINVALTFDAESEMCLVWAKEDEFECCPGSTTSFDDYCNICPDGITAGNNFVPWMEHTSTCKDLVEEAKFYENGTVGCNYYKGYEVSCCPNTPPSTTNWAIVGYIAVATLVGAAVAFACWKRKINSPSTPTPAVPTSVATSTNAMSSTSILTASSTVPQSTNVCNTPMPSQPTPTHGPRSSSLDTSRSFKDLIGEI